MAFRLEFEIPWSPPSFNKYIRMHWRKRADLMQVAALYVKRAIGVPEAPWPFRIRATFEVWHPGRRFDDVNVVVARKVIEDVLHKLGWLINDSPRYVESRDLPCRLGPARTKVLIEEISKIGR